MMTLITVCHTVIPEKKDGGIISYHAASSDEKALLDGAFNLGYIFQTRNTNCVEINALGLIEKYEILDVIEFTSSRKRMSVIVRCPDNKIKLYCKGADTVCLKLRLQLFLKLWCRLSIFFNLIQTALTRKRVGK